MEQTKGYVLYYGTLIPVILLKKCKVNYKVKYLNNNDVGYVTPERYTSEDEKVCVVWMMNRGIEGSYRIERVMYEDKRMEAKKYPRDEHVWEDEFGVLNEYEYSKYKCNK